MIGMIEALAETAGGGGWIIKAPRVGIYRGCPRLGGRRMTGDTVGRLTVLNRAVDLLLPAGVDGLVTGIEVHDRAVPVEYGQPLFTLTPVAAALSAAGAPKAGPPARSGAHPGGPLPPGCFAVAYGGPGLPARAVIEEIRAADATEVRQGAVLFVVRAA